MRIREYKTPLAISILAHAALAAILIWGALFFLPVKFGGDGPGSATVDVWLAGPDGGKAVGTSAPPVAAKSRPAAETNLTKRGSPGEDPQGEDAGEGYGSGVPGSGDGSPILASIWKRINSHKYYPSLARERGITGTPRVQFAIAEDGSVVDAKLAASCGEEILDDAAIETIRRAAPLPFYPGRITVGVKYSLSN